MSNHRELLQDCYYFCDAILKHSSIWKKGQSPIVLMKKQKIKKLSRNQKNLIEYLYSFFVNGKPVFTNQSNIAKKLGCQRQQIVRSLRQLEKRGLIKKFIWYYKNKFRRCLILPYDPIFQIFTEQSVSTPSTRIQVLTDQSVSRGRNTLVRKNLKSLMIQTPFYILQEKNKKELTTRKEWFLTEPRRFSETPESVLTQTFGGKMKRYKLKVKEAIEPIKPVFEVKPLNNDLKEVVETLLENNFDFSCISHQKKNKLLNTIGFNYGIDWKSLFKNNSRIEILEKKNNKLIQFLILLQLNQIPLDHSLARAAITYWNKCKDSRLAKIRIPKNEEYTKTYLHAVIAICYVHSLIAQNDSNLFYKGIDRFHSSIGLDKRFKFVSGNFKYGIIDFLTDPLDKDYYDDYFNTEDIENFRFHIADVNRQGYKPKKEVEGAIKLFEEIFVETLWSNKKEKGREIFVKNYHIFVPFTDDLRIDITQKKRILSGLLLTKPVKRPEGYIEPPVLQEYLKYLIETRGFFNVKPKVICDRRNWYEFVVNRIRNEYGYEDFWTMN